MEVPNLTGLARETIKKALDGMILTPERDAVVFDAVKASVETAYRNGVEVSHNPRKNALYASGVLVALAFLIFAGVWASYHFPAPSLPADKPVFSEGAPNWELAATAGGPTKTATDPVIMDAKVKIGTEWAFVGDVQYKDYLYLRTVNLVDNTQIRILAYHWTPIGGWKFYGEQRE